MKAVMLSLRPQWSEKIFNGSKTIEVRKSRPSIPTPFTVYVYCTKAKSYLYRNPNNGELFLDSNGGYRGGDYEDRYLAGKVIGSFVCDRIVDIQSNGDDCGNYWHEWDDDCDIEAMCLSYEELETYLGKSVGYGWHITEPKLFDKPRGLGEFYRSLPEKVLESGEYDCRKESDVLCLDAPEGGDYCAECPYGGRVQITRAPQSWVYCETIDER